MKTVSLQLRLWRWPWSSARYWTLQFEDPGVEAGFLGQQRADRFVSNMSLVLITICLMFGVGLLSDLLGIVPGPFDGSCDVPPLTEPVYMSSCYCIYGLIVAFLIFLNVPRLLHKTDPMQRERLAGLLFCVAMAWVHIFNPFYLTKLFGGNLHKDCTVRKINSPDLYIMLVVMNAIAASHLTVPIRWCILFPVEGATLILNAFCVFGLGSSEGFDRSVLHFCFLVTLVFMMAVGKRNTERAERELFRRLLSEKILRTQAEFELSRIRSDHPDLQSVTLPSTSPTDQVFQDIEEEGRGQGLQALVEVGHREQWLIDAKDVCILAGDTLLGHGGFGMVISASFHGAPVAVKAPLKRHQDEFSLADIGNELRILRRLRHPHIVMCHGAVIETGLGELALVLELVRGESMRRFIDGKGQGGQMPSCDARCQCLLGICCALVYLHSLSPPVVHGDLKSSNIMIQRLRGSPIELEVVHPKLLDFGIARVLTQKAKPLGGTVRWKAPELFNKPAVKPDRAADVYSFGCLLFFTVSGKQPLEELGKHVIKALRQRGAQLRLRWPQDSPLIGECEMMADQATVVDPRMRPSMQDIYEDLVQWPEIRQSHGHDYGFLHDMASASLEGSNASHRLWKELRRFRDVLSRHDPMVAEQPHAPAAKLAAEGSRPTLLGRSAAAPVPGAPHEAEEAMPDGDVQRLEQNAPSCGVRLCMQL